MMGSKLVFGHFLRWLTYHFSATLSLRRHLCHASPDFSSERGVRTPFLFWCKCLGPNVCAGEGFSRDDNGFAKQEKNHLSNLQFGPFWFFACFRCNLGCKTRLLDIVETVHQAEYQKRGFQVSLERENFLTSMVEDCRRSASHLKALAFFEGLHKWKNLGGSVAFF